MVPSRLVREAPKEHKFKVQMCDFSCQGLRASSPFEPYLKINFDNFKIFKTDHGSNNEDPEWGFKAGFHYTMKYLEQLRDRKIRLYCHNRTNGQLIGETSIDLQTVACGPTNFRLTLHDPNSSEPCGTLKFTCVMKMISSVTVIFKKLRLTMQGSKAPARLHILSKLATADEHPAELRLPHSSEGTWHGPYGISFETSLADLLKVRGDALESMNFVAIDEMGVRQGEATLPFRSFFSTKPETIVPFKVRVTYSLPVDGVEEAEQEPVGAVGELAGELFYQNLPAYAQMVGGNCVDGGIEGGSWLFEGLPYPAVMGERPPPLVQATHECFSEQEPHHEDHEATLDDIDDRTILEASEKIELPAPWEKRRERIGDRCRTYYIDPRSRRTTWKDPRFLPEHWDQRIDSQTGKVYYQYHQTHQTTFVDPRCCPQGWDMRLSKTGEIYFAFLPAMQTTFTDPRGLPEGFDVALDDFGRTYFKDHRRQLTTWDDPRDGQQEVTLTKWRHTQSQKWWKEQVWRELEELQKPRLEQDDNGMDLTG
eukprot:CAMPEP_0170605048 /NCGR_PEP_ID=MMETSP0224-20130122/19766_1 /TAXON_ID=285029 /ORGANISM="Togula jolla, Strain CCCM 725" /LENGTH=536 /DNA_ID=CAMNT_0010930027 /DNA_START=18 /DNA_END=1628 /DNA_ORIENTATION=+